MNTRTWPHRLQTSRPLTDRLLESVQHGLERWLERRARRREADIAWAVERELAQLDGRTLDDIGVGQRRWHSEPGAWDRERMLRTRGW